MSFPISEQTKSILLLTAPLIVGKARRDGPKILTPVEYNKLASRLIELKQQPVDLLGNEREDLVNELQSLFEPERLFKLLDRGLLMSQAIDQWQSRGIWIVSRADSAYPKRVKAKLKQNAPPILYGCGEMELLEKGGLGIVGSRKVDNTITEFVQDVAKLTANSGYSVVSGGARGVDQIAMQSALEVEGTVVGALAENLSRAVVASHYRSALRDHSLVLVSAVDPRAGFNVGNAMARNKLIYALSDAGLVANADFNKGGTWAGAIEQIDRFKCCPVYVRTTEKTPKGNQALIQRGAFPWPSPKEVPEFRVMMERPPSTADLGQERGLDFEAPPKKANSEKISQSVRVNETATFNGASPTERFQKTATAVIIELLQDRPMNEVDLADTLGILKTQARAWMDELTKQGIVEKAKRPVRYRINNSQRELFK